jgi:hypothetical protein
MSKIEETYEGHFLDALDLPEGVLVPVEIEAIVEPFAEKDAAGKPIKQAIVAFKGKKKRLILNKTNWRNLKAMFGRDHLQWIGQTITIQRRYLEASKAFGVQNTMAIRVVPPVGTPILRSAAAYMGQPKPYGQTRPKKQEAPPEPPPAEEPTPGEPTQEDGNAVMQEYRRNLRHCDSVKSVEGQRGKAEKDIRLSAEQRAEISRWCDEMAEIIKGL